MLKRIISFIFVVVILSGSIYLIQNKEKFNKEVKLLDSKEFNTTEVNSIDIDLISTDVEMKESSNDKVLVEYYSNSKANVKTSLNNNVVRVIENKKSKCKLFCNLKSRVVIYIPSNYTNPFDIKTVSGDVELKDIYNSNIITVSGDVEIAKAFEKISINTTSGDIEIGELNISNNSNINTISGDADIKNNSDCFIEVNTVSGDKDIGNNNGKSEITLKIETVSGDISVQ